MVKEVLDDTEQTTTKAKSEDIPMQASTPTQTNTKALDIQFLRDIVEGRIDIWETDPAERLEKMIVGYEADTEILPLWTAAVTAYTDFMIAKMQKVA